MKDLQLISFLAYFLTRIGIIASIPNLILTTILSFQDPPITLDLFHGRDIIGSVTKCYEYVIIINVLFLKQMVLPYHTTKCGKTRILLLFQIKRISKLINQFLTILLTLNCILLFTFFIINFYFFFEYFFLFLDFICIKKFFCMIFEFSKNIFLCLGISLFKFIFRVQF